MPDALLARLPEVDRLVHEPARLAVLALLYVLDSADYTFIMNQTGLTWGNLSAHLTKLDEGGYVAIQKTFSGKRPNTTVQLTRKGRSAFEKYATLMKQLLGGL